MKYCHLCGYEDTADTADTCFRCGGKMHSVPYEWDLEAELEARQVQRIRANRKPPAEPQPGDSK